LNGRRNLVDIVADDAKTNVLGVLLDNATKGSLGSGSHHIGFVKYDELIPFGEKGARLCELFYLFADNVNASVVRGVQLIKVSTENQVWRGQGPTSRICLRNVGPYIRLATAMIVEVFPVPGGP
jgi:hypothetical protein